ncbi:substrate-binding domain-containing protein [Psychromonas sp. 14N.309.X.WAT.B.A12]|uniref:substrate-binding domain-containing protein n=1 Tax=Psychromonas sp. 14N.309.X.WAT.B.A12 TaxID=2998322 RepID=UPI0025B25F86|nr:substrate-binding domain-containing protein [Psychromonas sp. 14N.309.X.WAT.B.A12]MDN2664288.1 substrate-binding domain-containing protein [Psychromonas sp. 14N.309.X.WAT.B.A12]
MATIKDVAKHAQVSTSTVSHVLNKTRYVSEEITEKVKAAVELLNYTPSALARSLKLKNTRTFGMLVTTSINPFFAEVVKGVERRCYEQGYNLLLCNTEGNFERLRFNIDMLLQKRVDGLLLMSDELVNQNIDIFERHDPVPTVVMDNGDTGFPTDKIQDNAYKGGLIATQYLIDNGHTKIGCIRGPIDKPTAKKRYAGFEQAMHEANLNINSDWVEISNFECEDAAIAFKKLYQKGELPTAIFVCNDMMAMGVINAANSLGLSIPDDLSIIGYDDIKIARYMTPSLTTIHQSKFNLGQQAFDTLLDKIQTKRESDLEIQLEPTLVERSSVKNLLL